nr:AN1-type zinc finger protein 2A isoform X2 [Equus caballus]
MEFPDLGKHCSEKTCNQLDFLPLKCDACKQDFCKDHFTYTAHKCPYAFKKDVQVPVCPLCNNPIPIKKGEIPDVVVGEHIDRDCKSHPGRREKIFTYRCSKEGCRRKEMLRVACDQCHGNFCIQHRHPLDHSCTRGSRPITAAGCSAAGASGSKPSAALHALSSSWLAQRLRYQSAWRAWLSCLCPVWQLVVRGDAEESCSLSLTCSTAVQLNPEGRCGTCPAAPSIPRWKVKR